ncbi:MAG: potassium channel family protein, partial [Planctomycetota bacterium]
QTPQPSGETKESKYLLLLISILVLAVLIPIHKELRIANLTIFGEAYVVNVLFVVVMILGVHAVSPSRVLTLLGTGLWIVALAAHTIGKAAFEANSLAGDVASTITEAMLLVGLIMLTWLILFDLFRAGLGMTRDRLRGAACAYLLMGLAWALAYSLVNTWFKDSFVMSEGLARFAEKAASVDIEVEHMVYYSFVTLTTLGYGDLTPVRPLAETLAFLEACAGQFYLTVLVAMLVGQRLAAWMAEHRS